MQMHPRAHIVLKTLRAVEHGVALWLATQGTRLRALARGLRDLLGIPEARACIECGQDVRWDYIHPSCWRRRHRREVEDLERRKLAEAVADELDRRRS